MKLDHCRKQLLTAIASDDRAATAKALTELQSQISNRISLSDVKLINSTKAMLECDAFGGVRYCYKMCF